MTTPEWVPAEEACAALRLSKHQLRHAIQRGTLLPGVHWLPGPTPNSPRRYNVAAIQQRLIELAGQLRRDDGQTFPPAPRQIETFQGLSIDGETDRIELHDGTGQPPACAHLGGLHGLTALLDLLGEIQRQGRRAAGLGRPLSDAHADCPALGLQAGIDATGCVVLTLAGRSLPMPLAEVLQLQSGLSSLLARELQAEAEQRGQLERLLRATPTLPATGVRHGG